MSQCVITFTTFVVQHFKFIYQRIIEVEIFDVEIYINNNFNKEFSAQLAVNTLFVPYEEHDVW
jgi:hypothetical protein